MRTVFGAGLAAVVHRWFAEDRQRYGPALCCEALSVVDNAAVNLALGPLLEWHTGAYLLIRAASGGVAVSIVDAEGLREALEEAARSEGTVSVADPERAGGCTVDFTKSGDRGPDVEVLVAAWGAHEAIALAVAAKATGASMFRGN